MMNFKAYLERKENESKTKLGQIYNKQCNNLFVVFVCMLFIIFIIFVVQYTQRDKCEDPSYSRYHEYCSY